MSEHKYPVGTWIAFVDYAGTNLAIDEVCYLTEIDSHPHAVSGYVTRGGRRIKERDILEARERQGGE